MLTLNSSAADEILRTADRYGYKNFVAVFVMASQYFVMNSDFREAYFSKSTNSLRGLSEKHYNSLSHESDFHFSVDIYDQSEFPYEPNYRIDGIFFYLPEEIAELVDKACLAFKDNNFSLKDMFGQDVQLPVVYKI
ncbi:MAG: hypothetical protein E6Q50_11350 [Lysobacter sp.]|nr:MAG: hypothetical protein E6Q50_11350 [Lysobacter sp.]